MGPRSVLITRLLLAVRHMGGPGRQLAELLTRSRPVLLETQRAANGFEGSRRPL